MLLRDKEVAEKINELDFIFVERSLLDTPSFVAAYLKLGKLTPRMAFQLESLARDSFKA